MTDADLDVFTAEVRRVATIFRFRASPPELGQIAHAYFKAFKPRPLPSVIAGADAWIATGTRFPKPKEWLDLMPKTAAIEAPLMGQAEAAEWSRAERLRWEDEPCTCVACLAAGVTDRPVRFVPETTEDDRDRHVQHPATQRIVTSGHWAHGEELARWYAAKAAFYAKASALGLRGDPLKPKPKKLSFKERMDQIFWKTQTKPTEPPPDREPGSDDE